MSLSDPDATATPTRARDTRAAIVAALNSVPGLDGYASLPPAPSPGAAWPVWIETNYLAGAICNPGRATYEVFVLLPADYLPETIDTADGLLMAVADELRTVGTLEVADAVLVQTDSGQNYPAVRFRLVTTHT